MFNQNQRSQYEMIRQQSLQELTNTLNETRNFIQQK